jgi:tetratricopeptide (TPR) repeat protein/predicted Ser/Thr protein kinase
MDPARYRQIKSVLLEALERPAAAREGWLAQRCGEDAELRREVEELLVGETQQSFLEHSPLPLTDLISDEIDASGKRLGRIRLDRRLAAGGMGEVYAGVDELLERPVAVKLMKASLRMSAARRSAFLAEARVLSGLRHPNICAVHDFFEDQDQDVLVLELIEGQTLRSLLQNGRPADPLSIAEQICDALVAAHERGIAHRDLKPENVMLTPSGRVKVLDFGLARVTAAKTTAPVPAGEAHATPQTQIAGTPGYLSPEQARGEVSTTATDLWSFGLLLGELLSGHTPWPAGSSSQELLQRASRGEATIPTGLARMETQLLRRLLAADPQARPSAREAREALRQIIARPGRRLRLALAAGLIGLALLSGWKYTVDLRAERTVALAAQARAESARAQAEDLAGFMLIDLYDGLRAVGRLNLLEPVALKAVHYYGEWGEQQMGGGRGENALALIRVAEVLDMQGHLAQATDAYRRAMESLQPLAERLPDDELVHYRLALATRNYAEVLRFGGDYAGSDPHARKAIEMARLLTAGLAPGEGPDTPPTAEERWSLLLRAMYLYADSLVRQGQALDSLVWLDEAESLALPAVERQETLRRDLADIRYKRCMAYFDSQRADMVVAACQASFEMDQALHQTAPEDVKLLSNLMSAWWMLGRAQELAGDLPAALQSTEAGMRLAQTLNEREPDDAASQNGVALLLVAKGRILRAMGMTEDSAQAFADALAITEPLIASDRDHATVHNHLIALTYLGRIEQARPFAREVFDSGWRRPEFLQLIEEFDLLPDVAP